MEKKLKNEKHMDTAQREQFKVMTSFTILIQKTFISPRIHFEFHNSLNTKTATALIHTKTPFLCTKIY